jgi:hypothetical protein
VQLKVGLGSIPEAHAARNDGGLWFQSGPWPGQSRGCLWGSANSIRPIEIIGRPKVEASP